MYLNYCIGIGAEGRLCRRLVNLLLLLAGSNNADADSHHMNMREGFRPIDLPLGGNGNGHGRGGYLQQLCSRRLHGSVGCLVRRCSKRDTVLICIKV